MFVYYLAEAHWAHDVGANQSETTMEEEREILQDSTTSVSLRTGHRSLRSLRSYNSLSGSEGKRQTDGLFGF